MTHKSLLQVLSAGTALSLSLGLAFAIPSYAQDTTEVIVTGSRVAKRSRLDTLAPVDVITSENLTSQASPELAEGLSKIAPSINFPRPAVTDGTDSVRPAILRGLSPDQTLVLVNGKRRHAAALVNINGSVGRGSASVDLNTIPESALDRLEILRDGASAQYGSDAIAGVVNLMLRKADHGGNITVGYSVYSTSYDAVRTSHDRYDGKTYTLSGWKGFKLGDDGFLTVSGEIKSRAPTSRGDIDTRAGAPVPNVVTSRYGDPAERAVTFFANAGKPINDVWDAYGWLSIQDRRDQSAANFRQSTNAGNVISIYPNGFLPMINVHSQDYSWAAGTKGMIGSWDSDFSVSYGNNKISYVTNHSVNASFGSASKTGFYDGYMQYGELVADANFSKSYDVAGLAKPLDVAFGVEARKESYKIAEGELQSYAQGPIGSPTPVGAQGFPGFTPANATDVDRSNIGVYLELGTNFTEKLSASAAVRAENYSDFGSNTSGKIAGRYDFTPNFALRGAVSTGFRAPSLQQQYFTSTATNFIGGVPYEITTFPVSSAIAKTLGAQPLKPEKSTNYALGAVFHKGPFELTVDGYKINIDDRIVLTENILRTFSPAVAALLDPAGGGRFFMNGVNTETSGIDVVVRYRLTTASYGRYDFSLAANNSNTDITKQPFNNTLSTLSPAPSLFAHVNQYLIAKSTPENKASLSVDWKGGDWTVSGSAVYYGNIVLAQSNAAQDYNNGDATLVNLSARYSFPSKTSVSFGVDNIFDTYPAQTPIALIGNGGAAFSARSPFGFNGRNLYVRVSQSF